MRLRTEFAPSGWAVEPTKESGLCSGDISWTRMRGNARRVLMLEVLDHLLASLGSFISWPKTREGSAICVSVGSELSGMRLLPGAGR